MPWWAPTMQRRVFFRKNEIFFSSFLLLFFNCFLYMAFEQKLVKVFVEYVKNIIHPCTKILWTPVHHLNNPRWTTTMQRRGFGKKLKFFFQLLFLMVCPSCWTLEQILERITMVKLFKILQSNAPTSIELIVHLHDASRWATTMQRRVYSDKYWNYFSTFVSSQCLHMVVEQLNIVDSHKSNFVINLIHPTRLTSLNTTSPSRCVTMSNDDATSCLFGRNGNYFSLHFCAVFCPWCLKQSIYDWLVENMLCSNACVSCKCLIAHVLHQLDLSMTCCNMMFCFEARIEKYGLWPIFC